jgi:peptidoglycan/LPS O-acetylase OafA/YrhL
LFPIKLEGFSIVSDQTNGLNEKDVTAVEFLNSFFITIVLYLHHGMYTAYHIKLLPTYNLNLFLQKMAVGGFFFLSGLKLTQSKSNTPFGAFIKNRFFRIYLLYFLAVICYSIIVYPYINFGRFPSFNIAIIHALGLQSVLPNFFGRNYLTLWFISNLFLCYIFFLLTRKLVRKNANFILSLTTAILIFFTIHNCGKHYDVIIFPRDIWIYFVYFGLGMMYAINRENAEKLNVIILFITLISGFLGSLYFITYKPQIWGQELINFFFYSISNISSYILIFIGFQKYNPSKEIKTLIQCISFSSFCVFLFHRPIWSIMNFLWINISFLHSSYIIILGTVCIFIICFRLQKGYNHITQKLEYVKGG